jgi:hypothetical protein
MVNIHPKEQKSRLIRINAQKVTERHLMDTKDTADTLEARTEHGVVWGVSNRLTSSATSED